jgi:hypothetical protein
VKKLVLLLLIISFLVVSFGCRQYHYEGAGIGGVVGGVAGALLDRKNPWRGGIIGAAIGGVAGATIADISVRGSREAAASNRPVEYYTDDRRGRYYAEPIGYDEYTRCRKVRERVWEDGRLVRDTVREVCEAEWRERRY